MPPSGVFNPINPSPAPSPAGMIRRLGLSGIQWSESDEPFPTHHRGSAIPLKRKIQVQSMVLQKVRDLFSCDACLESHLPNLTSAIGSNGTAGSIVEFNDAGEPVFSRQTSWPHLDQLINNGHSSAYCERIEAMNHGCPAGIPPVEAKLFETVRCNMSLNEICDFQETLVKNVASTLTADDVNGENMTRLDRMIRSNHPRITYRDAVGILRRRGFSVEFGYYLGSKYEGALLHYTGYLPIHITHFPANLKPYNTKLCNGDKSLTATSEYIFPFAGRIAEGAELESDPAILRDRLYNGSLYKQIMKQIGEWLNGEPRLAGSPNKTSLADRWQRSAQTSVQGDFEKYISLLETRPLERAGARLCAGRLLQYIMGSDSVADALEVS
ncbi:MAG: hypothetical protein KJ970_04115 [Candidatus Eisenbacteria bacterium]|uniref:Aminoacyl-tRNA synthetase class II (D/K/N) domain-containing protein n=1 Tax=Eiseniibacteriota bacterium TaxID=2212470 RepID=A0A948RUS8_UNCEI|nr:hypothetical protein [Candidatus Eisenbacteria bacterium]MBU1950423.1 hypothetical protein [Candidatus Eisenbacteria bacterium]MBU2690089.1 hypothetical protein [Candidatus Eisenbacteria bacterium]